MQASCWEDTPGETLPPLVGEHTADVCVVGLGGAGLAALAAARARGLSAIGVDAGQPGHGAAGRNGGFLIAGLASFHHHAVARFGRARATALYRATSAELERIATTHAGLVRRTGSLRIAADAAEREDCRAQLEAMRGDGLAAEPYDGEEGRGLLFPGDAAYDPLALCRAEARAARAAGAALFGDSPVVPVTPGSVRTVHAHVACSSVVVAVDGRLELLLPALGDAVRSARLQMLATAPLPERAGGLRFPRPVYARGGYDYWQQLPDRTLALGGARDVGGEEEWTTSRATSAAVQDALDAILRERLGVTAAVTHRWAATVAFTRNGLPLLARVADGVVACGAYNGTGNLMSRLCGRSALAIGLGERDEISNLIGVL